MEDMKNIPKTPDLYNTQVKANQDLAIQLIKGDKRVESELKKLLFPKIEKEIIDHISMSKQAVGA